MQEQGATTLQEAVRYTVGVTSEPMGQITVVIGYLFAVLSTLKLLMAYVVRRLLTICRVKTLIFLERIEILRGPSSVLFGQASPGGLVNIVSKRPQAENNTEVTAEYGTRDQEKLGIDSTGKLTDDGRVLYRIVGSVKQEDYRSDFTDNKRFQIAPSLTFKPDDKTSLTLFMNYMNDRTNGATASFPPHVGTNLSSQNGKIGTNFFSGEPGFDGTDAKETSFGWGFSHEFNDTWTVRQNARYTSSEWDYKTLYPNIFKAFGYTGQRQVARFGFASLSNSETYAIDNQVQAKFNVGEIANTAIFGLDYAHNKLKEKDASSFIATPFDLFNPVYGNVTSADLPTNYVPKSDDINSQVCFYAQDQMKFGQHWSLVAGLRHDTATSKVEDGITKTQTDNATTGRIGAVYLADNGLAPYISYSESFVPAVGTNFFNKAYSPKTGKQTEVGLRYQPLNSNSMYTASMYKLKESNRLSSDPTNPNNQLQGG